jgi:MYXO-CTERM domain-containing protein
VVSLQVTASPAANVEPGQAVTFTALVGNEGSAPAHLFLSLTSSDLVLQGASRNGASLSATTDGFDLGDVAPGVTTTITLLADVAAQETDTASATFQIRDPEQRAMSGSVTVPVSVARVSSSLGCGCGASSGTPALWVLAVLAAFGARVRGRRRT